jgi:hypothetical protein
MIKKARGGNKSLTFAERELHGQTKRRTLPQSSNSAPFGFCHVDRADNLAGFLRDCGKSLFQVDIVGQIQRIGRELLHDHELSLQLGYALDAHASTINPAHSQGYSILNTLKNSSLPTGLESRYPLRWFLTFFTMWFNNEALGRANS